MNEFIVCSVVQYNNINVCGRRHNDCHDIISAFIGIPVNEIPNLPNKLDNKFMTSTGRVVSRKEAWKIAEANKQIKHGYAYQKSDTGDSILISENLFSDESKVDKTCPKCNSEHVFYFYNESKFGCNDCNNTWD